MSSGIIIFLNIFLLLPFFIVFIKELISDLYLWQVKEYRFDRMFENLERTGGVIDIKKLIWIAFTTTVFFLIFSPNSQVFYVSGAILFTWSWYESYVFSGKVLRKKFLRPAIKSIRNLMIISLNLLIVLIAGLLLLQKCTKPENIYFAILTGALLIIFEPIITGLGVILTIPFAVIKRKYIINKGRAKLLKKPKVKVVSITGSYGKSTTKELVSQLLEIKFKVIKTEKNNNTDVGIAQTILRKLKKDTQIFVAEMGAYKIGEIDDCCYVAKPDISVITGIDNQHVALFGGVPEILTSSFEVIKNTKPNGLVILNGDNEYCIKLAEKTRIKKKMYFSIKNAEKLDIKEKSSIHRISFPSDENIFVSEIYETKRGLTFILNYDRTSYTINSNIKVIHNLSNLLAAVLVAVELGIPMKEVAEIINKTDFEVPFLNAYDAINHSKVIDDGYNINPTGFISALNYFDGIKCSGSKWVMTQGMIELGDEREQVYTKIAQLISKTVDHLYTTDGLLIEKVRNINKKIKVQYVKSVFDFAVYYKYLVKKNDCVLIEGAFPQMVLDQIYKRK